MPTRGGEFFSKTPRLSGETDWHSWCGFDYKRDAKSVTDSVPNGKFRGHDIVIAAGAIQMGRRIG